MPPPPVSPPGAVVALSVAPSPPASPAAAASPKIPSPYAAARYKFRADDALSRACRTGNLDLARASLQNGAVINAVDDTRLADGGGCTTPLMLAAAHGYAPLVEYLLEQGAAIEVSHRISSSAMLPLDEAHGNNNDAGNKEEDEEQRRSNAGETHHGGALEIIDLDQEEVDDRRPPRQRAGPESPTAQEEDEAEDEADEAEEGEADRVVHLSAAVAAAAAGQTRILRALVLDHGANLNLECGGWTYGDETPLLAAAHHGRFDCLKLLLDTNAEGGGGDDTGGGASGAGGGGGGTLDIQIPEALEHVSFAPACFNDGSTPSTSDLWWVGADDDAPPEEDGSDSDIDSLRTNAAGKRRGKGQSKLLVPEEPERCRRRACRTLLLEECARGGGMSRLRAAVPYFTHAWREIHKSGVRDAAAAAVAEDAEAKRNNPAYAGDGDRSNLAGGGSAAPTVRQPLPSVPLLIAHVGLADLHGRLARAQGLSASGWDDALSWARLYGRAHGTARALFGPQDEVTLTCKGEWACSLLHLKAHPGAGGGPQRKHALLLRKGVVGEGEPMLRAAIKNLVQAITLRHAREQAARDAEAAERERERRRRLKLWLPPKATQKKKKKKKKQKTKQKMKQKQKKKKKKDDDDDNNDDNNDDDDAGSSAGRSTTTASSSRLLPPARDPRVVRWQALLNPLQPGKAPLEPVLYLMAQETNPHYESPHRVADHLHQPFELRDGPPIPFPSEEALHPPIAPILDEIAVWRELVDALQDVIMEDAQLCTLTDEAVRENLIEACRLNWRALIYAEVRWRNDRAVVEAAVRSSGRALAAVSIVFRDDAKICGLALEQDWWAFRYLTPRLKRRKRLFRMAKERLLEEIAASPSGWRALEFADPMLRGDPDVVDAAMAASDEKAFRYVDRYVLSENIGWQTVWPKFRRRCCRRIVWTTSTLTCLSACAALAWLLVFVLLVNLIWPPVICEYSNTTIDNVTGEEIWFAPYEIEHEFGHECNRSAYREDEREASFERSAPDDDTREDERRIVEEMQKEEAVKEEALKRRRRRRRARQRRRRRADVWEVREANMRVQEETRKREAAGLHVEAPRRQL